VLRGVVQLLLRDAKASCVDVKADDLTVQEPFLNVKRLRAVVQLLLRDARALWVDVKADDLTARTGSGCFLSRHNDFRRSLSPGRRAARRLLPHRPGPVARFSLNRLRVSGLVHATGTSPDGVPNHRRRMV
jgi:hypothetical protein